MKVPVVRLAEVEKLIQEAEWAMKELYHYTGTANHCRPRINAFLASIAAWRTGQEG